MYNQPGRNTTMNQTYGMGRGKPVMNKQGPQAQPGKPTQNIPGLGGQQQQQQQPQPQQQPQFQKKPVQVQQNSQQNLQGQQVQQPMPQQSHQSLPQPQQNPAPAQAILSQVPISVPNETINIDGDVSMESAPADQLKWKRKKIPGVKVNRKLKRLRLDQRLRKTLMPKNAIMVLNEMKSGIQFVYPETSTQSSLFLVHAQLDGKTYVGQGLSKRLACQNAAENAFKSLVLEKMEAAAKLREEMEKNKNQSTIEKVNQQSGAPDNSDVNGIMRMDCINGDGDDDEKDDIPWRALANFALYKLLNEWQNQGTVLMMPKLGTSSVQSAKNEVQQPSLKDLPENADKIHPVMLLNQMRPGIVYNEINRTGNSPNIYFTLSLDVDGQTFHGTAKNKKEAKKIAAMNALKALYGISYPEENDNKNNLETMDFTADQNKIIEGFVAQQNIHN